MHDDQNDSSTEQETAHWADGESPNWDEQYAAQWIGVAPNTLAKWRLSGRGPPFSKIGRRIIYQRSEIEAWLARNRFNSTSEYDLK